MPTNSCDSGKIDNSIRSMISNGACRFQKKNCERWQNSVRLIISPIIVARRCGAWKRRCMTICSQITRVILSGAKDLTHEAWVTLGTEEIPSFYVRSPASLGMTAMQDRHLHLR